MKLDVKELIAKALLAISDTGWIDAQSAKGSIDYRIKNGVCYIRNKSNFTTPTGTYTTLFTLPQEYRPTGDIYKVVGGMFTGTLFVIRIKQSDGTVAIADHLGSNTNAWLFDISFVLN